MNGDNVELLYGTVIAGAYRKVIAVITEVCAGKLALPQIFDLLMLVNAFTGMAAEALAKTGVKSSVANKAGKQQPSVAAPDPLRKFDPNAN